MANKNLWFNSANAAFLYKQNVSTSSYYKSILISKDCIVKLDCQLAFYFKTIKFCCELRRAFLGQVRLNWYKYYFTYNNFGSLENSMWSVIQLAVTILYTIVRQTCTVMFARSDKRSKNIASDRCLRVNTIVIIGR
jgi:hypothetical protein